MIITITNVECSTFILQWICYNKGYRDIGYHVPQFNCQSCHDLWPESCQVTGITSHYVLSSTLSDYFIQGADINLNDVVMDRWYSSVTVDYCFHWTYQCRLIICLVLDIFTIDETLLILLSSNYDILVSIPLRVQSVTIVFIKFDIFSENLI